MFIGVILLPINGKINLFTVHFSDIFINIFHGITNLKKFDKSPDLKEGFRRDLYIQISEEGNQPNDIDGDYQQTPEDELQEHLNFPFQVFPARRRLPPLGKEEGQEGRRKDHGGGGMNQENQGTEKIEPFAWFPIEKCSEKPRQI